MVLLFEVAAGFRWKMKVERVGALTRIIWGCFSVARIAAGFNDIARTFREDEREQCRDVCLQVLEESNSIAASVCAGRIAMRSNAVMAAANRHMAQAPSPRVRGEGWGEGRPCLKSKT